MLLAPLVPSLIKPEDASDERTYVVHLKQGNTDLLDERSLQDFSKLLYFL